ncbi:hypothetical protein AWM70_22210 [Paenibacillus yonginensis]|uniref:NodB homology domain-containing protein n=1 Tax=Paenibacillus yonginensis TaxID=1462996 RepID=A0A1B1N695_9BACL|nr:polysaccharide deacetylase [Paenibacillus yonginensis]ANS76961.1 hypothetical protein AWM70_22210 [Paenibacillus yonginensis]
MYRKSWKIIIAAALWLAAGVLVNTLSPSVSAQTAKQAPNAAEPPTAQAFIPESKSTSTFKSAVPAKTVYLTFDDGPSRLTANVLDILDKYQVKATFFVLGQQAQRSPELIRQIAEGGHALGNHTYDHDYDKLYHNFSDFWGQIKQTEEILRGITGNRPQWIRAPGGTYGHFDQTYFDLLAQAGYKVFDWDVDSGDSERKGVPVSEIIKKATDTGGLNQIVLLMHDGSGHDNTVKALPQIIEYYKNKGFAFAAIGPDTKPVQSPVSKHLPQGRPAPSKAWIAEHIAPNAALFNRKLLPLEVSAGGVQTVLAAGEYEWQGGHFLVPVRALIERLGGTAMWDPNKRRAKIEWGEGELLLVPESGAVLRGGEGFQGWQGRPADEGTLMRMTSGTIWISLRGLLDGLGHSVQEVNKTEAQWEVKAS